MSLQRKSLAQPSAFRAEAGAYFAHRTATVSAPELLVDENLEVLWVNAAALALAARPGVMGLASGRLVLPQRRQEDAFHLFLDGLEEAPGVWFHAGEDQQWLIRAEPISPPDAARAFLLQMKPLTGPDRYLWADAAPVTGMTASESRVLRLLVDGLRIDQASAKLGISVQTARTHVRRIYLKLGVSNREQMFSTVLPFRWG